MIDVLQPVGHKKHDLLLLCITELSYIEPQLHVGMESLSLYAEMFP